MMCWKNMVIILGVANLVSCKQEVSNNKLSPIIETEIKVAQDSTVDANEEHFQDSIETFITSTNSLKDNIELKDSIKIDPNQEELKTSTHKPKPKFGKIAFEVSEYDFGEIEEGASVEYKFAFENKGNAPLNIMEASATCGCTVPSYPFIPIEPGESGYIGVRYNSVGKDGPQKPVVTVLTDGKPSRVTLDIKLVVLEKKK